MLERCSCVSLADSVGDATDSIAEEESISLPDSDPNSPRYLFYLYELASGTGIT